MIIKKTLFGLLLAFLVSTTAFSQKSTKEIMKNASSQAKKENKAVFVKFEASWCGWCKKMTSKMEGPKLKKIFDSHFVVVHIDVRESPRKKYLENPGAEALLNKYDGGKAGLPFWVILDKNMNVVTNSFDSKGVNLGYPGLEKEANLFIKKLKKSSNLTKKELASIKEDFIN